MADTIKLWDEPLLDQGHRHSTGSKCLDDALAISKESLKGKGNVSVSN